MDSHPTCARQFFDKIACNCPAIHPRDYAFFQNEPNSLHLYIRQVSTAKNAETGGQSGQNGRTSREKKQNEPNSL